MPRIVVLGAGFAGLWAALGAARKRDEIGAPAADVEILVVDRNPYHNVRVRNYEVDIDEAAIPLAELLDPVGVEHRVAEVRAVDPARQQVSVTTNSGSETIDYDRLVLTLGSQLARPAIPGLAACGFDVDSYAAAVRLEAHLAALGGQASAEGRATVVIVGAGFTGIEVATEMPGKLEKAGLTGERRIILVDPNPVIGVTLGEQARPIVSEALAALGVETRLNARVRAIDANTVTLSSGEVIPTRTVVWCGGMRASPVAQTIDVERDRLGRLHVDQFMRLTGAANIFAAGDVASCVVDGEHATVMSCQFARPMGRFAGNNVVADLLGQPMLALDIDWYVTVLDLGAWGALHTVGWDCQLHASGAAAKATKQIINRQRIYPPRSGVRADILAAAAPTVQKPPAVR
ncbi:NAD(P)/FAD-dependent oxidoreductase [Bradyrhizobium sp. AUGA SZCCT0240]|uniref:NAD(P)/FAD-dependent oxidoreductase n=1 Tax=unclassified Bradyrhizobium TaxID=2631580 RepID=UPI001BAA12ED|nr:MULTISPECIES: NAD(P)/FAD-dependent oxidoreductase [unclassified Bradyrhizobium]MBR1197237.1 NAD(P)/FAD-dependent oxidoreductase [Bradyrhizobium sp. AUGA SZCCT0158]MBR1239700.1 NAD(P)/FAD-dependent oxidoreductase [Bradyrhizobium sp. AUGA SZCCT0274]MBR1257924.1 NAD(P)/FAD-dependent oxidoreductase [Bradyrhizobium sp. AUGA SZCCT0240]